MNEEEIDRSVNGEMKSTIQYRKERNTNFSMFTGCKLEVSGTNDNIV
jgi:hypothetical protein